MIVLIWTLFSYLRCWIKSAFVIFPAWSVVSNTPWMTIPYLGLYIFNTWNASFQSISLLSSSICWASSSHSNCRHISFDNLLINKILISVPSDFWHHFAISLPDIRVINYYIAFVVSFVNEIIMCLIISLCRVFYLYHCIQSSILRSLAAVVDLIISAYVFLAYMKLVNK